MCYRHHRLHLNVHEARRTSTQQIQTKQVKTYQLFHEMHRKICRICTLTKCELCNCICITNRPHSGINKPTMQRVLDTHNNIIIIAIVIVVPSSWGKLTVKRTARWQSVALHSFVFDHLLAEQTNFVTFHYTQMTKPRSVANNTIRNVRMTLAQSVCLLEGD